MLKLNAFSRVQMILFFIVSMITFSSAQKTYNITGTVVDTAGTPLIQSTVMLLDMDSTFLSFSSSDIDGKFALKKVKKGDHLVKVTYLGHIPVTRNASFTDGDVDLGQIVMKEISTDLMEVIVKAARAPIMMRGDTIEYDATTFRVPEGSSVEDLLKRLPGIEIDQDGSISSDGHSVTNVTVDGKKFFGDDPKAATKNLPAEGISKVQVFEETTEEEEITGTQDKSNQNKTMNLELKDDFKSGAFGEIAAGAGDLDRFEIKGNYNRFNDKVQFSLIGVSNNTGRNGLSWNDYQGFMGSESWSFGDDGIYGFGGGGFMYSFGGNGSNSLESNLQSIFFSGQQNGFPRNNNGGINFNYDNKKTKLNTYYFINQKSLNTVTAREKETFLNDSNALENGTNINDTDAIGHKAELEFRQEIDSFHVLTIKSQFAALDNEGAYQGQSSSRFSNQNFNTNTSEFNNSNETNGHLINAKAVFSKKFRSNKRRRFGLNSSFQTSNLDRIQNQYSINDIFDQVGLTSRQVLDQEYDNLTSKDVFRINSLYVEPLGEKFTLQTFYNYSNRKEDGDREVMDIINNESSINTFLTRDYNNEIGMNRFGASLKFGHEGINLSVGAAYQNFNLKGELTGASITTPPIDKNYPVWIPNASLFFQPFRNSYVNMSYTVNVQEPQISNLQPVIDNSNPFYLREGNPDLNPQTTKGLNMYFGINKPLTGFRIWMNATHNFFKDQFITEEIIDESLITRIKPINFDGGNQTNLGVGINIPFKPNKIQLRVNLWTNIRNSNAFVNGALNSTKTNSLNPSFRLSLTPSEKFSLYLNTSFGTEKSEYNINSTLNQTSKNYTYGLEVNTDLFLGMKLESDFNLRDYENDRLNLDESLPIWNISLSKKFLPGKKGELRISAYDLFNKNVGISQFASNYSIVRSNTATLARYFLTTFTYNLKGSGSDKSDGMIIIKN